MLVIADLSLSCRGYHWKSRRVLSMQCAMGHRPRLHCPIYTTCTAALQAFHNALCILRLYCHVIPSVDVISPESPTHCLRSTEHSEALREIYKGQLYFMSIIRHFTSLPLRTSASLATASLSARQLLNRRQMTTPINKSEDEWRAILSPEQVNI